MHDLTIFMNIHEMSDWAILREIGRRIKRKRLDKNWTQNKLAETAGLNRTTIGEIERGASSSMITFVQVLRALDALEELNAFLPEPGISPLQLAKLKGKERLRASRQKEENQPGESEW